MKKIFMVLFALAITSGAFAQKSGSRGGGHMVRPHSVIVLRGAAPVYGYSPFYDFYSPYWGYPYYGYPAYGNRFMHSKPTGLDLQIADIKNDYRQKISAARHDTRLSGAERRKVVNQLKHDRDQQIIAARRAYYKLG